MTIDDDSNNNNENVARSLILMLSSVPIYKFFVLLFWIHFPHGVIIIVILYTYVVCTIIISI